MHIIHTCEIVISAGFHGAIVLRPFCTKYRLYGRMQKVYESIPFYVSSMTLHFPPRSSIFADIYGSSSFFNMCWSRYMSMKIQAPFQQSKNPSGKRGMYTFVYLGAMRHAFGVRVQRVLRVLRVQRVVVSPTAMSMYGCSAALVGAF